MPPVDPAVAAANAAKAQSDADELRRRMPHLFAFETKSTDDDVAAPLTAPAAPAPAAAAAATASPTPSASPSSAPAVPATDASTVAALTVKTVHTLTTFELRRELERRGLLSAELVARAAYEPFIAALVVALNEDQERADAASAARAQVEHAQKIIELFLSGNDFLLAPVTSVHFFALLNPLLSVLVVFLTKAVALRPAERIADPAFLMQSAGQHPHNKFLLLFLFGRFVGVVGVVVRVSSRNLRLSWVL
jgi:hypothetical protein